jgi:hypothetical protein
VRTRSVPCACRAVCFGRPSLKDPFAQPQPFLRRVTTLRQKGKRAKRAKVACLSRGDGNNEKLRRVSRPRWRRHPVSFDEAHEWTPGACRLRRHHRRCLCAAALAPQCSSGHPLHAVLDAPESPSLLLLLLLLVQASLLSRLLWTQRQGRALLPPWLDSSCLR